MPVIANGSVFTLSDALQLQKETNVNGMHSPSCNALLLSHCYSLTATLISLTAGVMAARGLLQNPALFSGYERTPMECVEDWINIALSLGTPTKTLHKHLMFMLFQSHSRQGERVAMLQLYWESTGKGEECRSCCVDLTVAAQRNSSSTT